MIFQYMSEQKYKIREWTFGGIKEAFFEDARLFTAEYIFRQIAKAELQYAKDNPPDTKVRRSMAPKPDIKKAPGVIAPK